MIDQHSFYVGSFKGTAKSNDEIEHNKALIAKFPWLWPSDWNWAKIPAEEYDYSWTTLDEIPEGWKKDFGEQMCEEIQSVLEKHGCVDEFHIEQAKEKYGSLRIYFAGLPKECHDEVRNVINKYEHISARTCCECGKPAKFITKGWICPYCADCAASICQNRMQKDPNVKVEELFWNAEDYFKE